MNEIKALIKWSQSQYHELPWRSTRTLYGTLVSEIMLQQTTVGTVKNHFERFLKIYPSIQALANSSEEKVKKHWAGLGYYRRAKNLFYAACEIQTKHGGKIPLQYEKLIQIKGIGEYTANALLSIGADQRALAIDANIERVLSRYYGVEGLKGPKNQKLLQEQFKSKEILNFKGSYRALNEAIMDLGRVYCQARKVSCELCPLSSGCRARKMKKQLEIPLIEKKVKESFELDLLRVIKKKENKVLFFKRPQGKWLEGQYELPTFIIRSKDKSLAQYPKLKKIKLKNLHKYKTAITKYKITNYTLKSRKVKIQGDNYKYIAPKDFKKYQITTASLKALK